MNHGITTAQKAQRELTIEKSIDEMKTAIEYVFTHAGNKYNIDANGRSDMFNTYHFAIQNGPNPALMDITMSEVEGGKTKMQMVCTAAYGSISSNSVLENHISEYLVILERAFKGEDLSDVKTGGSGAFAIIFIVIIVVAVLGMMGTCV